MASSLLALLDDIATVLDDVAILTKVAAKKTAGVLGDDLALNAEQVSGVRAERELPVVWAVFKGSLRNKLILVPGALAVSAVAPWLITPLLMAGGIYLCFEGFEKVFHKWLAGNGDDAHKAELLSALADPRADLMALERDKINGAIRTDFILSGEIVVITLGTVADAPFGTQASVLTGIALLMTFGVYGLVAGIVKLDDLGLLLGSRTGDTTLAGMQRALGRGILRTAPWLMKLLSVAGTVAMFLVGGGILVHALDFLHHGIDRLVVLIADLAPGGAILAGITPLLADLLIGVAAGGLAVGAVTVYRRLAGRPH